MKTGRKIYAFLIVALSTFPTVHAQGPPINTDTPILLGLEGKAVMLRSVFVNRSQLYQNGTEISDSLRRSVRATVVPVVVPYNLTSDFLLGAMVPVMNVRSQSIAGSVTSTGLGDVSLFGKYVLVQIDDLQETFRIIGKASLKVPTGNENRVPALGTGSWDVSLGMAAGWIGKRVGLYGDASYSFNGSSEGRTYGNTLSYNAAVGFRLVPAVYETYPATQWNLYLEASGTYNASDDVNSVVDNNSGGHTLMLAPGLQWIPSRVFLTEISLQFPIVQSLSGTQLGNDLGLVAGIRLLLY
ncbi:MAG: transporter [Bacteroidota bacterium]